MTRYPVSSTLPIYWTQAVRPRPDHRDPLNLVCGVVKRFGNKPTKPNKKIWKDILRFAELFNRHYFKPILPDEEPTFENWIANSPYDQVRREQLTKAHKDSNLSSLNRRQRRKTFSQNKSFCKGEAYGPFKKPRLINSRVDEAKVDFGPWFKEISDRLFALPPFIKYIPFSDRPEVIKRDLMEEGSTYVADDYVAYEAHFDKQHMQLEFTYYKYMLSKCPGGREVLKRMYAALQGTNECKFEFFKVLIEATRMSGDMNTSLGNSYTNLIIHAYWYWVNCGRPTDPNILRDYVMRKIKVEGDDSAASYRNKSHIPTEEQMKLSGFKVEHLEFDNLGDMSFCGCVFDPDDMIIVTDPTKVLADFGWVPRRYVRANLKMRLELMRAKALSYKYQYNGCPIITPFCDNIIRQTSHVKIRKSIIDTTAMYERDLLKQAISNNENTKPTGMKTRLLVERLFGITVMEQLSIEIKLCSVTKPFELDELIHKTPKEWLRTADVYVKSYYDGQFWVDIPLGNAKDTLESLQQLDGVTEKTFEKFKITGKIHELPSNATIQAKDLAWTMTKGT